MLARVTPRTGYDSRTHLQARDGLRARALVVLLVLLLALLLLLLVILAELPVGSLLLLHHGWWSARTRDRMI